jgi:quinol monooxygenase YgiN
MFTLTAKLKAKPGMEKEVEEAARSMFPHVNSESGTLIYSLHRDVKDPAVFLFYEQYKDEEAFKSHCETPYFKKLFELLDGKLAEKPEETFYAVLDSLGNFGG